MYKSSRLYIQAKGENMFNTTSFAAGFGRKAICCALMAAGLSASAHATEVFYVEGVSVTGSNRNFGEPIWDLGDIGDTGFEFVFGHNPNGDEPFYLTEDTPGDTVLVGGADPGYLQLFGLVPEDLDPELVNAPLHAMPVVAGPDGTRAQLPNIMDVPGIVLGRNADNAPVTLESWMASEGRAKIVCYDDGSGFLDMRLRRMIPNGMYTIWGVWSRDTTGDGVPNSIGGTPLGGVPNVVMTDRRGRARVQRVLNMCPFDTEDRLKYFTVAYHSELRNKGGVPDQALAGAPGGTTAHAAMSFPINVVPYNN